MLRVHTAIQHLTENSMTVEADLFVKEQSYEKWEYS
jgi:hypothetical protein